MKQKEVKCYVHSTSFSISCLVLKSAAQFGKVLAGFAD